MKGRVNYTSEPLGTVRVVEDFLPPPEDLVFKEESVKVTMSLRKSSVEFFKAEAKKHHTSYQAMIRRLLDLRPSSRRPDHRPRGRRRPDREQRHKVPPQVKA